MTYVYLKKSSSKKSKTKKKKVALVLFSLGSLLLLSAVVPIISFSFRYSPQLSPVISPLSNSFYNQDSILADTYTDYTHLSNWFVEKKPDLSTTSISSNPQSYTISIPKLNIKDASVVVGGEDLKKSLVHYPNTALPGQLGSGVIFGHSVLPQFFNPKSYLTIFSTLYQLKQGDEILVNYDNIDYKYIVDDMYEVAPSDLTVF